MKPVWSKAILVGSADCNEALQITNQTFAILLNTPGTRVVPDFHNQSLAVKSREKMKIYLYIYLTDKMFAKINKHP